MFLVLILVLVVADIKIYQKKRELNSQIRNYREQIADIKKNSQTLKDEIANANNTDYLEKLGYEQFDLARPGETEYMFVTLSDKAEEISNQNLDSKNLWDVGSWTSWISQKWNWIKSRF